MVRHNNQVPNQHFHKEWQLRVKTWFNQAARKQRRHKNRVVKAARCFPRPVESLRPIVRCPSRRYNMKLREGRGFSLAELRAAKISPQYARTIGIAVDTRRHNKSMESIRTNVARLEEYVKKLMILPINPKKVHAGETPKEEFAKATQHKGEIMPFVKKAPLTIETMTLSEKDKKVSAYGTLRMARADAKYGKKHMRQKIRSDRRAAAKKAKAKGKK